MINWKSGLCSPVFMSMCSKNQTMAPELTSHPDQPASQASLPLVDRIRMGITKWIHLVPVPGVIVSGVAGASCHHHSDQLRSDPVRSCQGHVFQKSQFVKALFEVNMLPCRGHVFSESYLPEFFLRGPCSPAEGKYSRKSDLSKLFLKCLYSPAGARVFINLTSRRFV